MERPSMCLAWRNDSTTVFSSSSGIPTVFFFVVDDFAEEEVRAVLLLFFMFVFCFRLAFVVESPTMTGTGVWEEEELVLLSCLRVAFVAASPMMTGAGVVGAWCGSCEEDVASRSCDNVAVCSNALSLSLILLSMVVVTAIMIANNKSRVRPLRLSVHCTCVRLNEKLH